MRFDSDYIEGCHPAILERMRETNLIQEPGYGVDQYCASARTKIRAACQREDVDVHFLVGGTQANATIIAHALRPYQGVLSAVTGHINGHETGAVESKGHKILPLPSKDGKIAPQQVEEALIRYWAQDQPEHEIEPKMVYLSQPTEQGTLYTLAELNAFRTICDKYHLYLFVDGARLGYALATPSCDVMLPDLAHLTDVFYIGGTKVGAMFGEAVVIVHPDLMPRFRHSIKQNGGMLAKGRFLGIQFDTLFTDALYTKIAAHAIELADRLRQALRDEEIPLFSSSPTNLVFPILPPKQVERLEALHAFERWDTMEDGRIAVRFCTSWATRDEAIETLIRDIHDTKIK